MNTKSFLIIIFLLFIFTRIYSISEIPSSVYWDEASIGYNAYSVSQNGKDEWGDFLPIHFRAFGEFKLPVYIYSAVPFVKLFGLNSFSIRLPAILFSLLSIYLTYLIVKIMFNRQAALFSSFILSIMPWFFIFSRTGYEVTAGIMFFLLGLYTFLKSSENRIFLLISTLSFIASIYSYNSFRIISPMIFIFLNFYQRLPFNKKNFSLLLTSILLFSLSTIPIIRLSLYDAGFIRTQSFRLFPTIQQVYDLSGKPHYQLIYDRFGTVDWWENLSTIGKNYLTHLSLDFLIFKGDPNPRHQQPGFGQIYILDLLMLSLGVLYLFLHKKKEMSLIFIILFFSLTSASLFKETPHALRSLPAAPFIAILGGLGLNYILTKKGKKVAITLTGIYLLFFINYFSSFIQGYNNKASIDWQFGYKKVYEDYGSMFTSYDHVVISDQYAQPYIFALFYQKYDPEIFRQEVVRSGVDKWGFSTVKSFDKFLFDKVNFENLPKGKNLVFSTPIDKMDNIPYKGVILNLDKSIAFYVYEYQK